MLLREADQDDLPVVLDLLDQLIHEDAGRHDPAFDLGWVATYGAARIGPRLTDPSHTILLASVSEDGPPLGLLSGGMLPLAEHAPSSTARLGALYVRPEHRSLGIGARLVDQFMLWCVDEGAVYVQVEVYAANEAALRFYQRRGLQPQALVLRSRLER